MRAVKIKIKTGNFVVLFFLSTFNFSCFFSIKSNKQNIGGQTGLRNRFEYIRLVVLKVKQRNVGLFGQKSSNFPTARYQKDSHYLEFSLDKAIINNQTTAISTASAISLETKEKDPNNPILFYRNILKDIDVNYQITKTPFRVKEEIILKANSKSQIPNHKQIQNSNDQNSKQENLTFFFSAETSGKPVRQPDGSIAFFGDNGDYLFS